MQIYHNPRCTKSRETLELLKSKGEDPEIVLYLKDIPTTSELKKVLQKLGISAEKLLRKNEKVYKEKFKGMKLSDDEWIEAMVANPKLIERPIVISGNKAVIGRPPSNVEDLLK